MQGINTRTGRNYDGLQSSLRIPNSVLIDEFGQDVGGNSEQREPYVNRTEQDNYVLSYDKLKEHI